jgi:ADP-ribosylglycohydrolase/protein-tyrosine phosphatase
MDSFVVRKRGTLIGLAVGDALGAAVEFQSPGSFEPVTDYRGGGPHGLEPGEWTDDTSMALALADSIIATGWDLDDQARRYVAWWTKGEYSVNGRCFDIGMTVKSALAKFGQTKDAKTSASASERVSGNGSIMRLAPVPIRFLDHFPDQIEKLAGLAAESSLPTHASPQCLSACRYMAIVLAGLMQGIDRDDVLSADWEPLQRLQASEPLHHEVDAVAAGSFRELKPPAIQGSGYVVKSLEAALWAFHDAQDFRQAVLKAVNLGDDADTTGAICGQLAGAYWGESGVPKEWLDGLVRQDMIEQALIGLLGDQVQFKVKQVPKPAFSMPTIPPPTVRCYWVIEGKFLAGAYPGSPDQTQHRQRVDELWQAGCRTYINLVEENETNNSGQPFARYDIVLRELAHEAGQCVANLRFPVQDLSVPSADGMRSILDAIDLSLAGDRLVYLHCFGGVGRTGTAVCCWMLRHGLADPHNIIQMLQKLRQADQQTKGRKAPENIEQIKFVEEWPEAACE